MVHVIRPSTDRENRIDYATGDCAYQQQSVCRMSTAWTEQRTSVVEEP